MSIKTVEFLLRQGMAVNKLVLLFCLQLTAGASVMSLSKAAHISLYSQAALKKPPALMAFGPSIGHRPRLKFGLATKSGRVNCGYLGQNLIIADFNNHGDPFDSEGKVRGLSPFPPPGKQQRQRIDVNTNTGWQEEGEHHPANRRLQSPPLLTPPCLGPAINSPATQQLLRTNNLTACYVVLLLSLN